MAGNLSIFGVLRNAMTWHQVRQKVLAENVANANTVGYRPHDLKPLDLGKGPQAAAPAAASVTVTDPRHLAGVPPSDSTFREVAAASFETTPDGNAVVLEEQMMRLTQNQLDYEMATTLYGKSLGLIRTALGRS